MSTERIGDILIEHFDVIACSNCGEPIDTSQAEAFSTVQCPACGNEMRVPARFANFILLEQLGKGGMGAVYKAYDETLGRTVAIKVMQQAIGQDRTFVDQFLQEARALAAINHPNIVQIYNYGEENGQPYIVMELVAGDRLDHIQEKHRQLDEVFVLETALQIIGGLQAANTAGMTHGDIKPANILYDAAGHAKVADFGLSRFKGEKPKPGEIWGTPYYVAPEVVRGQSPNTESDIYSLGGTLYHVLTGEPPFNGETVTDTILLRFKEPAPDPREFKPSVSAKTAAILLRMLEMDPYVRYPTYESLYRDVSDALSLLMEARGGKKKAPEKKNVAVPVILGLIVLALVGTAAYFTTMVVKQRRAENERKAQLEQDRAEGRVVRRLVGGRLVDVRVEPEAPAPEAAARSAPPIPVNEWRVTASMDASISGEDTPSDFQERAVLLLRAGNQIPLEDASKIYLRFPLREVDRPRLKQATLQLTAGRKGANKVKANPYQLHVWALKAPAAWDETTTWSDAPGNDIRSAGDMNDEAAVRLATFDIPANPETGDRLRITSPSLTDFIRSYPENELTLILTGDTETDHRGGWRITAMEDSERFPPPTLILDAK
ncbi:MAG: serine/threonine protein kinase [Verrucomicrobiota bacterium]|jgi:hypothetical protein|nr:serine/threonine protein kinase [Verrucomicrobiota bacterium]